MGCWKNSYVAKIWAKIRKPSQIFQARHKPSLFFIFLAKNTYLLNTFVHKILFTKFSIRFPIPLVYGTCRLRNYKVDKYKTNLPNLTAASLCIVTITTNVNLSLSLRFVVKCIRYISMHANNARMLHSLALRSTNAILFTSLGHIYIPKSLQYVRKHLSNRMLYYYYFFLICMRFINYDPCLLQYCRCYINRLVSSFLCNLYIHTEH